MEIETITRVLKVPASQNIGCSQCGKRSVQVITCEGEFGIEVVEAM